MRYRQKKSHFIRNMIILGILISVVFIYFSEHFERVKPKITFKNNGYWNLKNRLNIQLDDNSAIKYYKITFIDNNTTIVLDERYVNDNNKTKILTIYPPKLDSFYKTNSIKLKIEVIDNSKWNFLQGNKTIKIFDLKIDTQKPFASVLSNSRYIKRGGSALAIVKIKDENLHNAYIVFNNKTKFRLTPYIKDDYYIALMAWDIDIEHFNHMNLVAIDKAGNKTIRKVPLYVENMRFKKDILNISRNFISQISTDVLTQSELTIPSELKDIFIKQNNVVRKNNIKLIRDISLEKMDFSKIDKLKIKPFKRLRGSKRVANYGEYRSYRFNKKIIDHQWHLGIDWAKYRHTPIITSAKGRVIFNSYLGIYGNTIIIDHGLGLGTLYAHLSNSSVTLGEKLDKNQEIGITGHTGAALGDHLHFGVLVQGIEVDPNEWMNKKWIKKRIRDIIREANKLIKNK